MGPVGPVRPVGFLERRQVAEDAEYAAEDIADAAEDIADAVEDVAEGLGEVADGRADAAAGLPGTAEPVREALGDLVPDLSEVLADLPYRSPDGFSEIEPDVASGVPDVAPAGVGVGASQQPVADQVPDVPSCSAGITPGVIPEVASVAAEVAPDVASDVPEVAPDVVPLPRAEHLVGRVDGPVLQVVVVDRRPAGRRFVPHCAHRAGRGLQRGRVGRAGRLGRVGDRQADRLCCGQGAGTEAAGGCNCHLVDVVCVGVGRRFEVHRRHELQITGAVHSEQPLVGAPGDRVTRDGIVFVHGGHRARAGRVLGDTAL